MKRREKKSESLDIRLPFQQKQDFMAATKLKGETASEALRGFIDNYIEEARLAEHPNTVQEITMTLARHRLKSIATAAGAAIGVFSVTAMPSAADATVFEALDKNKDGVLTEGEIAPGFDAAIIEELDTDGSGGVSQAELEAAGNEIVIRHDDEDTEDGATRHTMRVLKFSDSEDGEIHGEITTEVDKRVKIKRMSAGSELSNEELEALVHKALTESGVSIDMDFDTETLFEDLDKDGNTRVVVKRLKVEKTATEEEIE